MPIIAKASSKKWPPAPAGQHAAVCVDVVDLGMITDDWGTAHKVYITWQIEELRDDGKPYQVSKRYRLSLHEKATLRKDLESWRGRPFSKPELDGFDLEDLLGVPVLLNVVHSEDGEYANVASMMKLPKQLTAPKVTDYTRVCDRETTNGAVPPAGFDDGPTVTDDDVPF